MPDQHRTRILQNLRRPHGIILALVIVFMVAWAVWTFILLPMSETPSLPNPAEPAPGAPVTRPSP